MMHKTSQYPVWLFEGRALSEKNLSEHLKENTADNIDDTVSDTPVISQSGAICGTEIRDKRYSQGFCFPEFI